MSELPESANTEAETNQGAASSCAIDPEYDVFVENLAKGHVAQIFTNQSASHALSILRNVFKFAEHDVNIFSGRLDSCVYNDKELISAAKDFIINRKGTVRVLVQDNIDQSRKDSENDFLNAILSSGGNINCTNYDHPLKNADKHFFVSDSKTYRVELDIKERSAVCNFNDEALGAQLNNAFNSLWDMKVTPLSLSAHSA